jgi:hypothetical protein
MFGAAIAAEGGELIVGDEKKRFNLDVNSSHCKAFLHDISGANTPVVELVQFCKSQRHGNLARATLFSCIG